MYELAFSIENANENLLIYLYDQLCESVNRVGGICKYLKENKRSRFALACNDLYASTIKHQSEDYLADVLTLGFKNLYVRKSLGICQGDFLLNTLVNTMCVFDNKFDKHCVKKSLNLCGEVCIDGYYNFRMRKLKGKWDELVEIVKNNGALLKDTAVIKEFLCYLMDFLPSSQKEISVVIDNDTFRMFDDKGRLIPATKLVYPSSVEELVAINAICIKPNNIKLYCDKQQVDHQFLDLLAYLFDVKVVQNS